MADSECLPGCEDLAELVRGPATASPTYASSECVASDAANTDPEEGQFEVGCECRPPFGVATQLLPSRGECLVYGRDQRCLYPLAEFPGCDLADAGSCSAICAELETRQAADAARALNVTVHGPVCERAECSCVLQIEGQCFEQGQLAPKPADCALTAREIVAP